MTGSKINLKNSYVNIHKLIRVDPPFGGLKLKLDECTKNPIPGLDHNKKERILKEEYEELIVKQRNEQKDAQKAIRDRLVYLYKAHKKLNKNKIATKDFLPINSYRKRANCMSV